MNSVITLITDFDIADAYVEAMKGVILGINLDTQVRDISQQVQPQNIFQTAFVLSTAFHMMVVDSGVATSLHVYY